MVNGFEIKMMAKSGAIEIVSWGPFRIYQLISKANPALYEWKWAGLAGRSKTASMVLIFQVFWVKTIHFRCKNILQA